MLILKPCFAVSPAQRLDAGAQTLAIAPIKKSASSLSDGRLHWAAPLPLFPWGSKWLKINPDRRGPRRPSFFFCPSHARALFLHHRRRGRKSAQRSEFSSFEANARARH